MSGIAGLRGTQDWSTQERPTNFRERILFISPNGNAPIFALTSKAGKYSVNDPQFSWWAESQNLVRVVTAAAYGTTDTALTVVGADPGATTMNALYGAATNLKQGDVLLVEPTVDATTFTNEYLMVDTVVSDTQVTVRRAQGGSTASTIANGSGLTLVGSAFS